MSKLSVKIKKGSFGFLLLILLAPLLQNTFSFFYTEPLKGSYTLSDSLVFNRANWFSGEYQLKQEKYIEDHIGFRSDFVRLHNQLDFSLYNIGHADAVIVGKEGYLFEENYIAAYLGTDFIGKEYINQQLYKARYLQDTLNKLGISLILAYAPGKASFWSEYIPDKYLKNKKDTTNYSYYSQKSRELGLNVLDLASYIMKMKDTSRFALFPKCSIHWSNYGFMFAADSTIHYIENLRHIDIPDIIHERIEFPAEARNTDYDIGDGLNLIWHIPFKVLPYPVITFKCDATKVKPAVLTIADSYYNAFYYYGIPENLFTEHGYWYYNKEVYPVGKDNVKNVNELDLKTEIEKQNVIMLLATEKNMWRYSFRFIDNAFDIYGPKTIKEKQRFYENIIKTDTTWLRSIEQQAKSSNTDLNALISKTAANEIATEREKQLEIKNKRILFYVNQIKNTSTLIKLVKEKVRKSGMSLNDGILSDAKWFYNNENPDPEQQLRDIEDGIRNNKELMKGEADKAKQHNLTLEDMIKADAKWVYENEKKKKK
jgi:hypothetical protein